MQTCGFDSLSDVANIDEKGRANDDEAGPTNFLIWVVDVTRVH